MSWRPERRARAHQEVEIKRDYRGGEPTGSWPWSTGLFGESAACGRCGQHCSVGVERPDIELVSVDLAGRGRRTDEARGKGAARYFRLTAVTDRAAAVTKRWLIEIRHGELQVHRPGRHVPEL